MKDNQKTELRLELRINILLGEKNVTLKESYNRLAQLDELGLGQAPRIDDHSHDCTTEGYYDKKVFPQKMR